MRHAVALCSRLVLAAALCAIGGWWVLGPHRFSGAVLFPVTATHGVHVTDVAAVVLTGAGLVLLVATRTPIGRCRRRDPTPDSPVLRRDDRNTSG